MPTTRFFSILIAIVLAAFLVGRWTRLGGSVKADSTGTPQIEVRDISGNSSLVVFYPELKKVFVYQTPFVGLPTWSCAYSVQLAGPGEPIDRQPCRPRSRF